MYTKHRHEQHHERKALTGTLVDPAFSLMTPRGDKVPDLFCKSTTPWINFVIACVTYIASVCADELLLLLLLLPLFHRNAVKTSETRSGKNNSTFSP
jgi:hypothetical protein